AEHVDGGCGIASLDLDSGDVTTLWTGAETISAGPSLALSLSQDGKVCALVRHAFHRPPEVWAGPVRVATAGRRPRLLRRKARPGVRPAGTNATAHASDRRRRTWPRWNRWLDAAPTSRLQVADVGNRIV